MFEDLQDLDVLSPPSTFIFDSVSAIDSTKSSRSSPLCYLAIALRSSDLTPIHHSHGTALQLFPVNAMPMIYSCACKQEKGLQDIPASTRTFQGCGVNPKLGSNQVAEPHTCHIIQGT